MKKRLRIALPIALVLVAGGLAFYAFARHRAPGKDLIRISGNIEVTQVQVSFKIAGRLESRDVDEGMLVKAGQRVAQLEKADLELEAGQRRAEVRVSQAALAELEAGTRPEEVAQAQALLDYARADATRSESEFQRQRELKAQAVATVREFEVADTMAQSARAKVREAEERLALLKKGPRREQIDQARARAEQAKQVEALAQTRLGYATLGAPLEGVVLSKNIEAGEYVTPGTPVITLGDLAHPWLRGYINETDLGRVKLGQKVRVTTDTYPNKSYEGEVTFIASQAEFTPKNVQTQAERVKLVYRIKVNLANPRMELKPGMPADAEILAP